MKESKSIKTDYSAARNSQDNFENVRMIAFIVVRYLRTVVVVSPT